MSHKLKNVISHVTIIFFGEKYIDCSRQRDQKYETRARIKIEKNLTTVVTETT